MNAAVSYFEKATELLRQVREHELAAIQQAAEVCASSIAEGGLVFLFGAGHSRMLCEEMTLSNHADILGANGLRAPLHLEKYEGYAEEILKSFHFGPHDAFIVISTSGIRPVVVEMAAGAKRRGMPVIAIVSR